MRVVAVDYGRARTGVAVSDETGTLARPVAWSAACAGPAGMAELLAQRSAGSTRSRIVVGLPLTLRGEHGRPGRARRCDFVAELRARCPVPVETYDERFTTTLAERGGSAGQATTRWPPPTCSRDI